jgi:hypothetical protein
MRLVSRHIALADNETFPWLLYFSILLQLCANDTIMKCVIDSYNLIRIQTYLFVKLCLVDKRLLILATSIFNQFLPVHSLSELHAAAA